MRPAAACHAARGHAAWGNPVRLAWVWQRCRWYNRESDDGGYSSAAERLTVAQDVVGSIPTSRPKHCALPMNPGKPALPPDSDWLTPYTPIRYLRGGHGQTLVGNFWPRPKPVVGEAEAVLVDPEDGSRVLCHCHWQRSERTGAVEGDRLTLLLLHGLEGSSNSGYILGITELALRAGCNVIRMNMRNCGGTEAWTPTLYHSGRSADVAAVALHFQQKHALERVAMIGYSMGGNLVLRMTGELGAKVPRWLTAVATVSPVTDLAESADALHQPSNRIYEQHFLRRLMRRYARKAELFPETYRVGNLPPIRSIRDFDEAIVAPHSGFTGADDYYHRASSARHADALSMPTLILHALDDPFIRMHPRTRETLLANSAVRLVESRHGGHCAFLAARTSPAPVPFCRHWAEITSMRFVLAASGMSAEDHLRWRVTHGG